MDEFEIELKQSTLNELEDTLSDLIDYLQSNEFHLLDLDELFRAAHSLKGNSKAADFDSIAKVTHQLEDLLINRKDSSKEMTSKFYDLLLTYSEHIQSSIEQLKGDISLMPNLDELQNQIESFEDSTTEESSPKKAEDKGLRKLLLVDDDIDIYTIVNKYLNDKFEIDYVSNAVQAIEDCKLEDYDLIICDYKMPVMNGQEFALYLRQGSSKNKETPMIFLTAFSPKLFNQKSIWEEVFFMDKPIQKKKLQYYAKCALQSSYIKEKAS
ncbi:hypothetical protein BIY24_13470 [Halobacteriovorax marinus]|uniref:ATP-binding response regulator n=1 Tax=Halobacteriovorax marinus TaxID=97084 RepID=UPI000BC32214|nr:response regulator [Halobacteriovorax marinus]ATH08919.1 hypothetical protein BIY24_13470 [Halobacteriovorax marinus]